MARVMRILFSQSWYAATKGRVKYPAFMPFFNEDRDRYETSVFQVDGLDPMERSGLEDWAGGQRDGGPSVKGRAEVDETAISGAELRFDRDDDPIDRHGNILDWPTEATEADTKAAQQLKALHLADAAKLHVR